MSRMGSLLILGRVGKILDMSHTFPAAFTACAAFEAPALVSAASTRETGCTGAPSW